MKKTVFSLLFVLMIYQISYSQDAMNQWSLTYTNNGRIYAMNVNPLNPSNMFIAGLDSGAYKTVNGGLNWVQINNGMTYFKLISFALAPSNASVLYAGTDQNGSTNSGVYVSTDAGATWTLKVSGITETALAIQSIAVHPTNPNIAWVAVFDGVNASTTGIFKTTNGGTNWVASSTGIDNKNILSIAVNPLNPNVLYAGSSLVLPGSTGPSKMYKSFDGGNSWVAVTNGLPTGTTTGNPVRALSISTLDTSVVLAALFVNDTTGGVYVTTNGGNLWNKKWSPALANTTGSLYRSCMIKPGSSTEFYVGLDQSAAATPRGVYRSTDGGNTWVDFNTAPMLNTFSIRALGYNLLTNTLYAGAATASTPAGIGLFEYSFPFPPPTGSWTEQTSGITTSLYSVSAVDDNVAWACGASGKVLRTTNKGAAWTNVSGTIPTTVALYCIFAWDANTAIVTGVAGTTTSIYQTANGGTTWTLANSHTGFGDDLYMSSPTNAYFIGDPAAGNWDLLSSVNGGLNWASWTTLATTNTAGTYNNAAWFQGTQIWFPNVGLSQMYYSSNMGANWATQTITLSEITATCFNSPTVGLAGGSTTSPGLLKTTNGGTTWAAITSPFTTSISGIAGASTSWWVAQQGLNIAFSSNDGTSWATQYTVTAGSFYHLTKSRSGATLWGVRSNGAISRYGQPLTGITPVSNQVPSSYSLSQNYPNPFNPVTKINFALPKSGLVTLKVYDILGKEVATLVNEVKNAGTYNVEFNASKLSSGVYFYRVETNDFTSVKKMMLIK